MIDCVITITILVEDNTLYFIHFNHKEGKRLEGAPVVNRLFEKKVYNDTYTDTYTYTDYKNRGTVLKCKNVRYQ